MPLLGSRDDPMENPKDVFHVFRLLYYMLFAPFIDALMECNGSPCPHIYATVNPSDKHVDTNCHNPHTHWW